MNAGKVFLIFLSILLAVTLPAWPYSGSWSYAATSGLSLMVCSMLILLLLGRI